MWIGSAVVVVVGDESNGFRGEHETRDRVADRLRSQMNRRNNRAWSGRIAVSHSNLSRAMKIPFSLPFLSLFPLLANAYTWQFTTQPSQCQNLNVAIKGSGQPPYTLLIIPVGPTPLPNNTEVRLIQNIPFSGSSTTLSFKLTYPENSSFVAVVRSFLSRHISSVVCSCRATMFAGKRQQRLWLRWCQHSGHRPPIVRFELLQCLSARASTLVFQRRSSRRNHSM